MTTEDDGEPMDPYPYEIYYDHHASGQRCKQWIVPHYEIGEKYQFIATVYDPRPEFEVAP